MPGLRSDKCLWSDDPLYLSCDDQETVDDIESDERMSEELPSVATVSVSEYSLPMSSQTHELVYGGGDFLLITQQTSNSLIQVSFRPETGTPINVSKVDVTWEGGQGPHGLCLSKDFPGSVYTPVCQRDCTPGRNSFGPTSSQHQSQCLEPPVKGPHCVVEDEGRLWVTCKDSGHLVRIENFKLCFFYPVSARPIFVAVTKLYVYCTLDVSSKILCFDKEACKICEEISVDDMGKTPVGLVTGADGHAWFVLLESPGIFGRLTGKCIQWLKLRTSVGGLIHIAFEGKMTSYTTMTVWLLGSSMASSSSRDAVYTVQVEIDTKEILYHSSEEFSLRS